MVLPNPLLTTPVNVTADVESDTARIDWLVREINYINTAISQVMNQSNSNSTPQNEVERPEDRLKVLNRLRGQYRNELSALRSSKPMGCFQSA